MRGTDATRHTGLQNRGTDVNWRTGLQGRLYPGAATFERLLAETAVHPDNKALLDELGAYLTSATIQPRRTAYGWQTVDGSDLTPRIAGR